jgi:hypothetical protein
MEQLFEYRQNLLARYKAAALEFRTAVETATSPKPALPHGGASRNAVEGSPREADEWSTHQIAVHVLVAEKMVYGMRVRRTLEEDDPLFENFDGETWMAEYYNADEPLAPILDELVASVQASVARLTGLQPKAWTRPSRHAAYGGGFTVQTWVERGLAHIEEHLKTVKGK